jgi:hypothetical protein
MSNDRAWPAPWVFSLLILPLGMIVGFTFTPLPFLLAKAGVHVDRIARQPPTSVSSGVPIRASMKCEGSFTPIRVSRPTFS